MGKGGAMTVSDEFTTESMLDLYLFETTQLLEQLEEQVISSEKNGDYNAAEINEIFRIMHSIKGSSAMMMFENIAKLAHGVEDVFSDLREAKPEKMDYSTLSDLILTSGDFIKNELEKLKCGGSADGDAKHLINEARRLLSEIKGMNPPAQESALAAGNLTKEQSAGKEAYMAHIFFEDDCQMENLRAYTVIPVLQNIAEDIAYYPEDIMENDETAKIIRKDGFKVFFSSDHAYAEIQSVLENTVFLKSLELLKREQCTETVAAVKNAEPDLEAKVQSGTSSPGNRQKRSTHSDRQGIIGVNVAKLDTLLNLVGELVVAQALVIQNPDLQGLSLTKFTKAARQLEKITGEIQDTVMSVRMLPLAATFHKMDRIVRDMCKKLSKKVRLELSGEDTEVDKNIIEHISDPLMHIIRNAIDHGIETGDERQAKGKNAVGTIILEAKHDGNDVVIVIKDDGRGLNRDKILKRAKENGILHKPEAELTDKEIYSLIFLPGFSTNEQVTEFSGRGVGMDVVAKNINSVGGLVVVESAPDEGTTISLKIPLTLAIVEAMIIRVGSALYTVPITAIKESFRPKQKDIIVDPDGNEIVMVRGECYPIIRIHQTFHVKTEVTSFTDGIIIMVENESNVFGLFVDEVVGQQQVVVKALPLYIKKMRQNEGLAGCTLLGDGSVSLILDIGGLIKREVV